LPENPLLPNKQLRTLYSLMRRTRTLEQKAKSTVAREALLAATTIHLLPGDILCSAPGDATLADLAPSNRSGLVNANLVTPPPTMKLTTAASIARGQLAASPTDSLALTVAYAVASTAEPGWQQALTTAQQATLPFILIIADATGTNPSRSATALTWLNLTALARRIKLPILSVDGEDAVAVYRCMQESVHRARANDGPAVIWAVLTPPKQKLTPSQRPLACLAAYMKARNISLPT
jgi:pyruvate dehydrogenase E1 component alpha subunit